MPKILSSGVCAAAVVTLTYGASAASAIDITPHRALYDMSLSAMRNSSPVTDVEGKMLFAWGDACDGWTVEQRFKLLFSYAEGGQDERSTTYATWEAKDGSAYRFNVRQSVNGQLIEELRGEASIPPGGVPGEATFDRPEVLTFELPEGTLFPTAHSIAVLEHAMREDVMFTSLVFDGSDLDGLTEISAVIGNPEPSPAPAEGARLDEDLLEGQVWPIRLAFFPVDEQGAEPDYEMTLRLQANGVAPSMLIDYGDFVVRAELEGVEALPAPEC